MTETGISSSNSISVGVPADTKDSVKVLSVTHWNDRLFHFTVERPSSFRSVLVSL